MFQTSTQSIDSPAFPTSFCTLHSPRQPGSAASQACQSSRSGASATSPDTGSTSSSSGSLPPDRPALRAGRASGLRRSVSKSEQRAKQLAFGHRAAVAIIQGGGASLVPSPTTFRRHPLQEETVLECTDWNPLPGLNNRREKPALQLTGHVPPGVTNWEQAELSGFN